MQEALYHPEFGYYTARIDTVGRGGDFSTAATLTPLLAQSLATVTQSNLSPASPSQSAPRPTATPTPPRPPGATNGSPPPSAASGSSGTLAASGRSVTLLEIGPGDGSLAKNLLAAHPRRLRRKTRLHLVEISPRLQAIQRQTLAKYKKQITWHTDIIHALDVLAHPCQGRIPNPPVTLIYSNELVDAFPASVYEFNPAENSWSKLHLAFDPAKGIREILLPSPPPAGNWPQNPFPSTQRVEVHESYRAWLNTWLPILPAAAALLTIDYGNQSDTLYHRRPKGTLRAYHRHQRLEGPEIYARFGRQDLTADVNFTHLIDWGTELGLETVSCQTQREFILTQLPHTPSQHHLLDKDGAGDAFKVLHQKT
jgi:SAM-dependent MidA family methyltransferase